jgi:hypothetical protein
MAIENVKINYDFNNFFMSCWVWLGEAHQGVCTQKYYQGKLTKVVVLLTNFAPVRTFDLNPFLF